MKIKEVRIDGEAIAIDHEPAAAATLRAGVAECLGLWSVHAVAERIVEAGAEIRGSVH